MSYKAHFSRFLSSDPARLHAAAHSHHPWPDVTFSAQQEAWLDAARLHDDKWDLVFGDLLPEMQRHVARRLALPDPSTVAFAPNTHELVSRVVSCLPQPARVLTTDAEFHSFARQLARWEEDGRVTAQRVPAEPLASLPQRLAEAAAAGGHDLVYFSHVLFDSAFVIEDVAAVVDAVADDETYVVVDGYHGFMALPTDFSALAGRAFYTAGGYKYAMAGEGACFMHCPDGYGERPVDTGWLAAFGELTDRSAAVTYAPGGWRFLGATFDPSGVYRFNAVQRWLDGLDVGVADIHDHVAGLQDAFVEAMDGALPPLEATPRGHFLSLPLPDAAAAYGRLRDAGVVTDYRADRLRIGFGLYHDADDIPTISTALRGALKPT